MRSSREAGKPLGEWAAEAGASPPGSAPGWFLEGLDDPTAPPQQPLDWRAALRMFVSSVSRMLPGTELEIFRYDAEHNRFQVLEVSDMAIHSATRYAAIIVIPMRRTRSSCVTKSCRSIL